MQLGANATIVRYSVLRAIAPVAFTLRAIVDRAAPREAGAVPAG